MITLRINGKPHTFSPEQCHTLEKLLDTITLPSSPFAVAVNKTFIPQSAYATTSLQPDDAIELVIPMQGG